MCRTTAGPLLAIIGVAGTAAGVGLAVVRERLDRISDSRASKQAAQEKAQNSPASEESRTAESNDID
ncbi:MAG: hypothetical protein HQ477_06875 [Chloroflexi bacterium]|nr:hypothetical protein [Chloroflexota bacterium]